MLTYVSKKHVGLEVTLHCPLTSEMQGVTDHLRAAAVLYVYLLDKGPDGSRSRFGRDASYAFR
jgi:hypothetical protein